MLLPYRSSSKIISSWELMLLFLPTPSHFLFYHNVLLRYAKLTKTDQQLGNLTDLVGPSIPHAFLLRIFEEPP